MTSYAKKINVEILEKVIFNLERETRLIKEDCIHYEDIKQLEDFIHETVEEAIINVIYDNIIEEVK